MGVNGVAGPLPLSLASASCLQAGHTHSGQPQDALLQRQIIALRGHLAELRAATERCMPTHGPKGDRASWGRWPNAQSRSGREPPSAAAD